MICIDRIEQLARIRSDKLNQRRHPQRASDVVYIPDEHHDADDDQHERDDYGEARNDAVILRLHFRSASIACAKVPTKIPIAS